MSLLRSIRERHSVWTAIAGSAHCPAHRAGSRARQAAALAEDLGTALPYIAQIAVASAAPTAVAARTAAGPGFSRRSIWTVESATAERRPSAEARAVL